MRLGVRPAWFIEDDQIDISALELLVSGIPIISLDFCYTKTGAVDRAHNLWIVGRWIDLFGEGEQERERERERESNGHCVK